MFSLCFKDIIESRKEAPLLKLVKELGGWPVLMGNSWSQQSFNWQETVAKLRQYNNDILVAIWIGPDYKNSDDYIVQVRLLDLDALYLMIIWHEIIFILV